MSIAVYNGKQRDDNDRDNRRNREKETYFTKIFPEEIENQNINHR